MVKQRIELFIIVVIMVRNSWSFMKTRLQVVSILTARSLLSKLQRMGGSQWCAGGDLVPVMPYKPTIFRLWES